MNKKPKPADPLLVAFGRAVLAQRNALGISQEELAHRADLHRTYIGDIERGKRNVALKNIWGLAAALEIPADELIRITARNIGPTAASSTRRKRA